MATERIIIYKDGILTYADRDVSTGSYTISVDPVEQSAIQQTGVEQVRISDKHYASNDSNITVDDVYNKIQITCELNEVENLISSPLEDEDLYSPSTNHQKYCTEIISEGEGESAFNAFREAVFGNKSTYDALHVIDWYVRAYKSHNWTFNTDFMVNDNGTFQHSGLQFAATAPNMASIVGLGSVEQPDAYDNTVKAKIDMSKYLVISVNGNGMHTEDTHLPTDLMLNASAPCARYTGNMSGGLFSPIDDLTTNYIVFSGDIVMNARTQETAYWWTLYNTPSSWWGDFWWHQTWRDPQLSQNGDGAYYTIKWYGNPTPTSDDVVRYVYTGEGGIRPYNSEFSPQQWKYNYSARSNSTDLLLKLPVIACRLKIGDKYCCELYNAKGESYYVWRTEDELPVEVSEDGTEAKVDWFSIGPNPAIGDYIVGKSYKIANNITAKMNLDVEGMAIPIKKSDKLSGQVQFEILGPVNTLWNDITRRHKTWFRSEKWFENSKYLLASTGAIFLKDFEVTIHTDNGLINNDDNDNDLIYFSDVSDHNFINIKDDIEFNISTALTSDECLEKGVKQSIKLNNPIITSDKYPLRTIYNTITKEEGKAEEHYINNYYNRMCSPRILFETTLNNVELENEFTHYSINQFEGKDFYIVGEEYNLKQNTKKLKIRES